LNKARLDFVALVKKLYQQKTSLDFDANNIFIGYTPKHTIVYVVPIEPVDRVENEGYVFYFEKETGNLVEFGQMIR
jgi:hypothetical protein